MKDHFTKEKIQYNAPVWACILFILFLFFLQTGYQEIYREADQCVAKVLETDDSAIIDTGLVRSGEQRCKLEIISGKFKGEQTEGVNMLNGSLEQDKMFYPGDTAQVVVSYEDVYKRQDSGSCTAGQRTCEKRRDPVWNGRQLADLETERRKGPCYRLH